MSEEKITGNITLKEEQLAELNTQLDTYYNQSTGYQEGELGTRTRIAWDYYYGKLPEPITQGSSKWVDRSVWESVNGTLQELISVFTSGEDAVRFAPINSSDANNARAATKMVNKVLLRDNPGYNVLHDAFKECLITRNSFIKRYWTTEKQYTEEEFNDMSPEEFDTYMMNLGGEVEELDTEEVNGRISGYIKYFKIYEGVRVEYVPFEQIFIEPTATSLKDCNYIAHRVKKTKDELVYMGFDKKTVEELSQSTPDFGSGVIESARLNGINPLDIDELISTGDEGTDKVWLHEHYMKTSLVSGETEILQIFTVNMQILEINRVSEMPFETMTPFPTPGTIWGESVFDITKDVQDLNTTVVRGMIDNVMNANFRRYTAVKNAYDRASLLNNRPGGVVEVSAQGAVTPMEYHQLPSGIAELLDYSESKKEARTGVSKVTQGIDPSIFRNDNSTATVSMVMSAAQNRLRMVARNIAQRGMMNLMLGIYELIRQNGTQPIVIETANGEMAIDPKNLPPRTDMIVNVAVGNNERGERAAALQNLLVILSNNPAMQQFMQPNNAFFLATQLCESMGIYDVENYITPLNKIPPKQPDPSQQMQLQLLTEQIKGAQVAVQKGIADIQNEREKLMFEQQRAADEVTIKREASYSSQDEAADKMELERIKLELEKQKLVIEQQKLELKRQEMMIEAQMEMRQNRPVGLGND